MEGLVFIVVIGVYLLATFGASLLLARLAKQRPKAFLVIAVGGLIALLLAALVGKMEWDTLRLTALAVGLALTNGFVLDYALQQRRKRLYLIFAIVGAIAASYLVTKDMYPEPTLFFYAVLFYGIPAGSAIGLGLSALLAKVIS